MSLSMCCENAMQRRYILRFRVSDIGARSRSLAHQTSSSRVVITKLKLFCGSMNVFFHLKGHKMTTLFTMLMLHYLCDQTANMRALSHGEAAYCMENYQAIKLSFINAEAPAQDTNVRAVQNRQAYARFKAWEAANPEMVADLKSRASGPILQ